MKQKIQKNKNVFLVILSLVFSLSGVVVFAEVVGDDKQIASDSEAQLLEASVLSLNDKEDKLESTGTDVDQVDEELAAINDIDALANETNELKAKQAAIDSSYKRELAQIDKRIVPDKYKGIEFSNIGTISAEEAHIAISNATDFVNIRETASEDSNIVGKLYNNNAAVLLSNENGWAQVESGSVIGYVTTDYLNIDLTKDEVIENYGNLQATITVDGLNIRKEAADEAEVLTVVYSNEKYNVVEVLDGWVKISKDDIEGYISRDYANLSVSFSQAISIEEEQELIRQKEEAERKAAEEAAAKKAAEEAEAQRIAAEKKAAEDAAAKQAAANAEAERKAAAQREADKKAAQSQKATATQTSTSSNSGGSESAAKEEIARRESGGSYNATNGQYIGRYQLSASYLNGDHSPENQERTADRYVANRYGSWQNALSFWNNNGWY